jgi:hypothetical protein
MSFQGNAPTLPGGVVTIPVAASGNAWPFPSSDTAAPEGAFVNPMLEPADAAPADAEPAEATPADAAPADLLAKWSQDIVGLMAGAMSGGTPSVPGAIVPLTGAMLRDGAGRYRQWASPQQVQRILAGVAGRTSEVLDGKREVPAFLKQAGAAMSSEATQKAIKQLMVQGMQKLVASTTFGVQEAGATAAGLASPGASARSLAAPALAALAAPTTLADAALAKSLVAPALAATSGSGSPWLPGEAGK